jgi:hypothetical protein
MTWGTLGRADGDIGNGVVFFAARIKGCSLGLGGSSSNVVGEHPSVATRSGSNAPTILEALRAADPNSPSDILSVRLLQDREASDNAWELDTIEAAVDDMRGVTQNLEFVARRLIEGVSKDGARRILLGSPLYVALAD